MPESRAPSAVELDTIALAYWAQEIRPTLDDLPIPGLRYLRDRYVLDVQDDPEAQRQLREWWLSSPFGSGSTYESPAEIHRFGNGD